MTAPALLLGRKAALTAVSLAGVTLGALLIWFFLVPSADSSDAAIERLGALQAEAAALPRAQAQYAALRGEAQAQPSLLQGDSDALAQAALQSDIKSLVEANGGEVRSAFAVPPAAEQGLSLISVQYDVTIPLSKLRPLAYAIESHVPYLFLSTIDVAAPQSWPADKAGTDPRIELRWTVSGYRGGAQR